MLDIKINFSVFFYLKNVKKRFTFLRGALINRVPSCKKLGRCFFIELHYSGFQIYWLLGFCALFEIVILERETQMAVS